MVARISKIMRIFRSPAQDNGTRQISHSIREIVFRKYNNKCAGSIPGLPCDYSVVDALQIDHVLPRSIFCINRTCNLQLLCSNCHSLKTKNFDRPLIDMHKQGQLRRKHVREHLRRFL